MSIWFPHVQTDWHTRRNPSLQAIPFVLAAPDHGRMIVTAANIPAQHQGACNGMTAADARAIIPGLQVLDDDPERPLKILTALAAWFIRYTPVVGTDAPDGLLLNITGCAHLWGSEARYLADIHKRLHDFGYTVQLAIAGTIGAAWALAHYGQGSIIIESNQQHNALQVLPPAALRLGASLAERLQQLGLHQIGSFMQMPRTALRRRFGRNFTAA